MDKKQYQVDYLDRDTVRVVTVTAESPHQAADQAIAQTNCYWWDVIAIREMSEKK